ncbi:MAG: hypothetical protein KGI57_12865, partial [Hyphomicrobiales bacterium]|nr:hypothetical protein [Hyphomicrobiales bacterium]
MVDRAGEPSKRAPSLVAPAAAFGAFGVGFGLWAGASAQVLTQAGVSPALYGLALTLETATYVAAMWFAGRLSRRFGVRATMLAAIPVMAASLAALDVAWSAASVVLGLAAAGIGGGGVDLAMNAEATRVEAELRRPALAAMHARASAGFALGAIAGSWVAVRAGQGAVAALAVAALSAAEAVAFRAMPRRGA